MLPVCAILKPMRIGPSADLASRIGAAAVTEAAAASLPNVLRVIGRIGSSIFCFYDWV
jgi:hypothetical protein